MEYDFFHLHGARFVAPWTTPASMAQRTPGPILDWGLFRTAKGAAPPPAGPLQQQAAKAPPTAPKATAKPSATTSKKTARAISAFAWIAAHVKPRQAAAAPPKPAASALPTTKPAPPASSDPHAQIRAAGFVAGHKAERARLQAILTSRAGQAHPLLARELAFGTAMPAAQALRLLDSQPAPVSRPARARGAQAQGQAQQLAASSWDRAFAHVRAQHTESR